MSSEGKAIIVSAPSGAGKTTIVRYLLDQGLGLSFSVSATNRQPRKDEDAGKDYYFFNTEEMEAKIKNGEFIEWEEVYEGQYYGTLRSEIERIWKSDKHVIFDVDVIGGINLKQYFGDKALAVFIQPPFFEALEARLRERRSESEETLKRRLDKAAQELTKANEFDKVIINDKLSEACEQAEQTVRSFLEG